SPAFIGYASMLAARDRLRSLRADAVRGKNTLQFFSVFKNNGLDAGASQPHAHCQLVGTNFVPPRIANCLRRSARYAQNTGSSLHGDLLRGERSDGRRIVMQDNDLIAYCPFASRMPMQVRIESTNDSSIFESESKPTMVRIAEMLHRLIAALRQQNPSLSYNYHINTSPVKLIEAQSFQWSIDLFPRLTRQAGFEFGSDCFINPVTPESAADFYRSAPSILATNQADSAVGPL
ncbi:MAG: DUF4921 family protein, partial [Planctomycetota bacterium]